MGDEFYTFSQDGVDIDVSTGLTVRVIAKTGSKVQLADGGESKNSWHTATDAAGIISMNPEDPLNSGYVYLSNSEEADGDGGVYGLYFDNDGNILDYKALLTGTTDNCGGGHTPWNTWISCEEYSDGQCWQIDPYTGQAKETELGGAGGRYESVAVDNPTLKTQSSSLPRTMKRERFVVLWPMAVGGMHYIRMVNIPSSIF